MMPFLIAFITVLLIYLFLVFPSFRRHPDSKVLKGVYFAHRGLHGGGVPENSIAAFANAVANGYGIELDIRLTVDGEAVVFHDKTLKRVCGVDGAVEEKTLVELKELYLLNTEEKIPTLKEVLSLVDGRVPLMVEFKSTDLKCDLLCETADRILSGYNGKYCIESFNPMAVFWYKKHRKEIFRGQLAMDTRNKNFISKISSTFLFNFLSRPDFVSFEVSSSDNVCFLIQKFLGAFTVGWTFESAVELSKKKNRFDAYIFENFKP